MLSSCFRCFGSGNAAPAVLIRLFRAICTAQFGLIIRLFEADGDAAVPGRAEPHIQRGQCTCEGRKAMYRSSNHQTISKKSLRRGEASLDYMHRLNFSVKHFFSCGSRKSKMSISAGRKDLALAVAFKFNHSNGFGDLADAKNITEI